MFSLIIPGAIAATLGLIQMLPPMRRLAAARGMSGDIIIPSIITIIGYLVFLIGLYL